MTKPKQKGKVVEMDTGDLETLIKKAVEAATRTISEALQTLSKEVKGLKEELVAKDKQFQDLEIKLENKLVELEQYGRRNNLRIFGVQETRGEKTDDIVLGVAQKMGLVLDEGCIDRSHRIGKVNDKPRPIIVKFTSYAQRRLVFSSKKKLKGTKITVREDLTRQRLQLLKDAISVYTEKRVWSYDGVVKVDVGLTHPLSLKTSVELQELINKYPPGNIVQAVTPDNGAPEQ